MLGRSSPPCGTLRPWLAVALTAAGFVLLVPDRVAATCGSYVQIHGPMGASNERPITPHATPPAAPNRHTPCHGPHCSQSPRPAPFVPVPPPTPSGEHWAAPVSCLGLAEPGPSAPADPPGATAGIHRTTPPDPPPRLTLS